MYVYIYIYIRRVRWAHLLLKLWNLGIPRFSLNRCPFGM